ncbi:MAG: DUF4239 domain-containing protein [Lentisphaeria bacterium]
MNFLALLVLLAAGLFVAMLLLAEVGRRIGIARLARDPDGLAKGIGTAEGTVFALLGLLIAFTFSGAGSRFEGRRHLVTEEANAVGTAYLRLDLLPAAAQPELRDLFRRYVDLRTATYQQVNQDLAAALAKLTETEALQGEIWARAVAAVRQPEAPAAAAMLLLPALNAMIDITTTRKAASQNHPPPVVFVLLIGLSLMGALLVGYDVAGNQGRTWLHTVAFAAIMSLSVYVILDLEYPRLGLIRVDAADQHLVDLRKSMH